MTDADRSSACRKGHPCPRARRGMVRPFKPCAQVRILPEWAGVGPEVWQLRTGRPYVARLALEPGLGRRKNPVQGWAGAGQIEAVGAKVTDFKRETRCSATARAGPCHPGHRPHVPLPEAPAAFHYLRQGHPLGKLVSPSDSLARGVGQGLGGRGDPSGTANRSRTDGFTLVLFSVGGRTPAARLLPRTACDGGGTGGGTCVGRWARGGRTSCEVGRMRNGLLRRPLGPCQTGPQAAPTALSAVWATGSVRRPLVPAGCPEGCLCRGCGRRPGSRRRRVSGARRSVPGARGRRSARCQHGEPRRTRRMDACRPTAVAPGYGVLRRLQEWV